MFALFASKWVNRLVRETVCLFLGYFSSCTHAETIRPKRRDRSDATPFRMRWEVESLSLLLIVDSTPKQTDGPNPDIFRDFFFLLRSLTLNGGAPIEVSPIHHPRRKIHEHHPGWQVQVERIPSDVPVETMGSHSQPVLNTVGESVHLVVSLE